MSESKAVKHPKKATKPRPVDPPHESGTRPAVKMPDGAKYLAAEMTALAPRPFPKSHDAALAELLPRLLDASSGDMAEAGLRSVARELDDLAWILTTDAHATREELNTFLLERLGDIVFRAEAALEIHTRLRRAEEVSS